MRRTGFRQGGGFLAACESGIDAVNQAAKERGPASTSAAFGQLGW